MRRHAATSGGHGTSARTIAVSSRSGTQKSVLRISATNDTLPTSQAGRNRIMT